MNSVDGAQLSPGPSLIETFSGEFVDLENPDQKTINIVDIAHGLSMCCRYAGHVKRFYSVAEHSLLVYNLLRYLNANIGVCTVGLFHDAAEAYIGDVTSPLKWSMRQIVANSYKDVDDEISPFDHLERKMTEAISTRFHLPLRLFDSPFLQVADMWAMRIEAYRLTHSQGSNWRWPDTLHSSSNLPTTVKWYDGLEPYEAATLWEVKAAKCLISTWCRRECLSKDQNNLSVG